MSQKRSKLMQRCTLHYGYEICQEKTKLLLKEICMPNGLLPLRDIEECGYVKETGFVWLKEKKSITHKNDKIGKLTSYTPEITAVVEKNKIKKLTGVKTKGLLVWISLSDVYVGDSPTGKITFKTPSGISRSFPVSACEVEEEVKDAKEKTEVKKVNGTGELKEL